MSNNNPSNDEWISLTGIQTDVAQEMMKGNLKLFIKMLERFYLDHSSDIDKIKSAINTKDLELLTRLVHDLKGLSKTFGAMDLHFAVVDLYTDIQEQGTNVDVNLLSAVEKQFEIVINSIKNEFSK